MKVLCKKHYDTLKPVDEAGFKVLGRIKQGEVLWVDVVRPRNERQHRLYWALCQMVSDNTHYPTKNHVHDAFRVAYGHAETFVAIDGSVFYKLKSTSFDEMDQDAFNAYFEFCIELVSTRVIPDLPQGDIRRELETICGVNPNEAHR